MHNTTNNYYYVRDHQQSQEIVEYIILSILLGSQKSFLWNQVSIHDIPR